MITNIIGTMIIGIMEKGSISGRDTGRGLREVWEEVGEEVQESSN